ncbi:MAG: hypothetical protein L0027_17950, partial [Candidatus Rokubacteria bacterium]|nr:hypothetical protein [Candidatus Rokubacteria bacterium]
MTAAGALLAAWLSPAMWLALPVLIVSQGAGGLWLALVVTVGPLIAVGRGPLGPPRTAAGTAPLRLTRAHLLPAVVLLIVVGVILWASFAFAGDVATWLGRPRWHGVALAAAASAVLAAVPGSRHASLVLMVVALAAAACALAGLVRTAGVDPREAWSRLASRPAFTFSATSP